MPAVAQLLVKSTTAISLSRRLDHKAGIPKDEEKPKNIMQQ